MTRSGHVMEELLRWLPQNADRVITVSELTTTLELNRTSIQSALRRLQEKFPGSLERKTSSSYIWHSQEHITPSTDLIMLKVLRRKDRSLLAVDEDAQEYYSCKVLDF